VAIDCATLSQSELLRPLNRSYISAFRLPFSITIIGQGSFLLLPLTCWLKTMFLVNSRTDRFYASSLASRFEEELILANVLSLFAEFLKRISALTFVFSTCSLVSDWYSFPPPPLFFQGGASSPSEKDLKRFFLIPPLWGFSLFPSSFLPFQDFDLETVFLLLKLSVNQFFFDF